jgi:hypothetical protein
LIRPLVELQMQVLIRPELELRRRQASIQTELELQRRQV